MSRWKVQKIGDMWEATDPLGEYTQAFLWWGLAMEHADEMARTIEVKLLRITNLDGCQDWRVSGPWPIHIDESKNGELMLRRENNRFEIAKTELKPLAQALLAKHYYRKEEQ